jgi:hypothetical protein
MRPLTQRPPLRSGHPAGEAAPPTLIESARAVYFCREIVDDNRTLVAVWPTLRRGSDSTRDLGGLR